MEQKKEKKKNRVLGWFENLWFYHKWHILVGALILVTITIATVQCIKKTDPDIAILYVGTSDIGADRESMLSEFGSYFDDINGDGEKTLSFVFMGTGESTTSTRVQTEMAAGDHCIYILNDEYYERMVGSGVLAPIHEALGFVHPDAMEDGYGIRLKYLHIGETTSFGSIERNSIICIRGNDGGHVDTGKASEFYMNNLEFFRSLCAYDDGNEFVSFDIGLIGEQTMKQSVINAMEYSVYNIYREKDATTVPLLNYYDLKVAYDANGFAVIGEDAKAAIKEFASGNRILLVDADVYTLLRDSGCLASLDSLGIKPDDSEEKYGVVLSATKLELTPGFSSAKSTMYLCGTADIDGNNALLLKYLREWTD